MRLWLGFGVATFVEFDAAARSEVDGALDRSARRSRGAAAALASTVDAAIEEIAAEQDFVRPPSMDRSGGEGEHWCLQRQRP
jgi:hypothetical protein